MNAVQIRHLGLGMGMVIGIVLASMVGCEVDERDVIAAREDAAEQQQDVQDAIQQGREDIAEAERERYEARRPPVDEMQEAEENVEDARREAEENVQDEREEAADAKAEAERLEQELAAKQERDAYVQEMRTRLEAADNRIEALEARAADMEEGAEKDQLDAHLAKIRETRDNAESAIDDMESAETLQWANHHGTVDAAVQSLENLLDESP